jgi:hypothetical protein
VLFVVSRKPPHILIDLKTTQPSDVARETGLHCFRGAFRLFLRRVIGPRGDLHAAGDLFLAPAIRQGGLATARCWECFDFVFRAPQAERLQYQSLPVAGSWPRAQLAWFMIMLPYLIAQGGANLFALCEKSIALLLRALAVAARPRCGVRRPFSRLAERMPGVRRRN